MSGFYHLLLADSILIGILVIYGRWVLLRHRSLEDFRTSIIQIQPLPPDEGEA